MPGVKIPHVDHATVGGCRKGWEINHAGGRVHVTKSEFGISNSDLKKLKGHVNVCRAAEQPVWYGRMNVGNKAIPCVVNVRSVVRERGSGFPGQSTADKSFLNEYNLWVMAINVGP